MNHQRSRRLYNEATVQLNNIAVKLLQKGMYSQARYVLGDAVSVARSLFEIGESSVLPNIQHPNFRPPTLMINDVKGKLQSALLYLSAASCQNLSYQQAKPMESQQLKVQVLSSDDERSTLEATHDDSMWGRRVTVFEIRPSLVDDPSTAPLLQGQQTAFMLYNFAVAFQCLAHEESSKDAVDTNLQTSLWLFQLAYTLLPKHMIDNRSPISAAHHHHELWVSAIPISILLLESLTEVLIYFGRFQAASEAASKLLLSRQSATDLESILYSTLAAAAA